GVVQEPLLGLLLLRHVVQRADAAQDLAIGADDGPRAQLEPVVMAVRAAQAEGLYDAAAAVLKHDVQRRAEAVAVIGMQCRKPVAGGTMQAAGWQAKLPA